MKIYNHKLINDLAWAIGSDNLLGNTLYNDNRILSDDWYKEQIQNNKDLLLEQDNAPYQIQNYLSNMSSFRLGYYFENLITYWFTINPKFEVLKTNFVITSEVRTLGEIDLIIRDLVADKVIHIEIACKFYLEVTNQSSTFWFGTNTNDRLDLKLDKLLNQQIELSNTDVAKSKLSQQNIKIDEHWIILKGRLFQHNNLSELKPIWLTLIEFNELENDKSKWIILEKAYWLAELSHLDYNFIPSNFHSRSCINDIFIKQEIPKPMCIAEIIDNKELRRIFITPTDWKEQALATL